MKNLAAAPDALLGWMGTLADPGRLRLLRLLERNELAVDELRDVLQLPQSTVSRHLKVLADEGLTRSRRHGTTNLYRTILDELEPAARKLWLLAREQTEGWPALRQDELRLERRLSERRDDSQAFFAGAAGEWDRLRSELYGNGMDAAAMLALLPSDYVVADLGCGTGAMTAKLSTVVKQVIAVDNSQAMLKAAKRRIGETLNVDLRRGELDALPIDDAACDAATLILALTYVPDPPAALREAARVLKPGRKLVAIDLLPHDKDDFRRQMGQQWLGLEPRELEQTLVASGFATA